MVHNQIDLLIMAPIVGMATVKQRHNGVSHGLSEAGYDIRIKQEIRFKRTHGQRQIIRLSKGETGEFEYDLITQGSFVLASAIEEFNMPNDLVGIVHDKSTWARLGLSVFNTVIEPGWKGFLTLELVYHGEGDLTIPAGSGIAQVIFHRLSHEGSYEGKYQNQENEPVPARES